MKKLLPFVGSLLKGVTGSSAIKYTKEIIKEPTKEKVTHYILYMLGVIGIYYLIFSGKISIENAMEILEMIFNS